MNKFIEPSAQQRAELLAAAGEKEALCRDPDRKKITSLSRSRTWQLEREGKHPKRRVLGPQSVAWLKSDLLAWLAQQAKINYSKQIKGAEK
ncbi:helix-turn-helix transcriptional regulator [Amphritea sp. HPY]|uniref:helix-turn-helix transcriptional regulator n=1 Tax=Amphritea sp. HPY TaxID=3421652 RepID=UPI003D7EB016